MSLMNQEQQGPVDTSHLENVSAAATLVADVQAKVKRMRQLEAQMIGAEAAYSDAKKQYETYKATVVIAAMTNAGIEQMQDENGNFIRLESKYYCNPNKNDADRLSIQQWLTAQGLEHLFKHEGKVDASQYDKLKEAGIPFADKIDVNTNSLKSALIDLLGYKKGGIARISLEDIPECMHFVVAQEVVCG